MNLINKKDLRNLQIKKLTEFEKNQQKQLEDRILKEKLLKSRLLHQADNVGISISMALEVDTAPIIAALWKMKKKVYIPRCLPKRNMEFTLYNKNTSLEKTKFGVLENHDPKAEVKNDLDLIIVPGLAYRPHHRRGTGFRSVDRKSVV